MEYNNSMGTLYTISEWILRLLVINLLWIMSNVPIIYVLMNLLMVKNTNQFIATSTIIFALMPFLFFPATTGMFAVTRKWVMNEKNIPVVRSYWKYYRENYVKSMLGGLILSVIWAIFVIDYYYFTAYVNKSVSYLFLFFLVILLVFTLHFISTIVHFESKLSNSLKNALIITIGRPFMNLGLGILYVVIIYVSIKFLNFLIPLFMGSAIAFVSFKGYYKVYLRIKSYQEQKQVHNESK